MGKAAVLITSVRNTSVVLNTSKGPANQAYMGDRSQGGRGLIPTLVIRSGGSLRCERERTKLGLELAWPGKIIIFASGSPSCPVFLHRGGAVGDSEYRKECRKSQSTKEWIWILMATEKERQVDGLEGLTRRGKGERKSRREGLDDGRREDGRRETGDG